MVDLTYGYGGIQNTRFRWVYIRIYKIFIFRVIWSKSGKASAKVCQHKAGFISIIYVFSPILVLPCGVFRVGGNGFQASLGRNPIPYLDFRTHRVAIDTISMIFSLLRLYIPFNAFAFRHAVLFYYLKAFRACYTKSSQDPSHHGHQASGWILEVGLLFLKILLLVSKTAVVNVEYTISGELSTVDHYRIQHCRGFLQFSRSRPPTSPHWKSIVGACWH